MRGGNISDFHQLKNEILQNRIKPVYIFLGEEIFLKHEIISLLKEKIIGEKSFNEFNIKHIYAEDTAIESIIEHCNTLPSFSDKKIIIVDNIEAWDEKDIKVMEAYLKDPASFTCLVLNSSEQKIEKIKKWQHLVPLHVFYPLYEKDLKVWIMNKLNAEKKIMQPGAMDVLIQTCNNSLIELNNEVNKLILYAGENREIVREDVENLIVDRRQYDIFGLVDAISQKKFSLSTKIFSKLYKAYEEKRITKRKSSSDPKSKDKIKGKDTKIYGFFSLLSSTFHELYLIKYEQEINKKSSDNIRNELGMHPFRFKKIIFFLKQYHLEKLNSIIALLFNFENRFKGSSIIKKDKLFQDLIYQLCVL